MKRVLALQFDLWCSPALVGERLSQRGIEVVVEHWHRGTEPSSIVGDFNGLLVLGGPQNLRDEEHLFSLSGALDITRSFHDTCRPILGLCLGAQIIGSAFGATVSRAPSLQFGFTDVHLTAEATLDPLLSAQKTHQRLWCWHEDQVELPVGAVHLATSDPVKNYGFRIGATTYGFQFHLELGPEHIAGLVNAYGHLVPKGLGDRGERLLRNVDRSIHQNIDDAMRFGLSVTDAWADLIK